MSISSQIMTNAHIRHLKLFFLLGASSLILACNSPIDLDVVTEVKNGTQSITIGDENILVPHDWEIFRVYRKGNGPPVKVTLEKRDYRGLVAFISFQNLNETPDWSGKDSKVKKLSTDEHQEVYYVIHPIIPPSGDDTPGNYSVTAWTTIDDTFWEMTVTFFVPIKADLKTLIDYIDALKRNKKDS